MLSEKHIMKKIEIEPRYIVDNSGKKKEVILNIKTFEKILEQLEDMYLAREAQKALQEDEFIDFEEANKKTLSSGVIRGSKK